MPGTLTLGRLILGPPVTPLVEPVGDPLAAVGAATVAGARTPQQAQLQLATILDGSTSVAQGQRNRRKLRSLLNNSVLKFQGLLYIIYSDDTEQNGWYAPDASQLQSFDNTSFIIGLWQTGAVNWNVLGHLRTHREAREIWMKDLRQSLYERDTLGWVVSFDFVFSPALALTVLPPGISGLANNVTGQGLPVLKLPTGQDGSQCSIISGLTDLAVVSYERPESYFNTGDVTAFDRRGKLTYPTGAVDTNWEEVLGPDWPWSWQGGIGGLSTPTSFAAVPSAVGGTLQTGNRSYVVTSIFSIPGTSFTQESLPTSEVTVTVTGPLGSVALSWKAVTGATGYKIYYAALPGAESLQPSLVAQVGAVTSYTDTGSLAYILEYPIAGTTFISNLCIGPDGNVWFAMEGGTNKIGTITLTGVVTTYTLGNPGDNFGGINPGPDGNVWITDFTNATIYAVSTSGTIVHTYANPGGSVSLGGITQGNDANMWFLASSASKIGRITTAGVTTMFTTPSGGEFPHGINLGPDGNLWVAELSSGKVSNVTTAGVITDFALPVSTCAPYLIHRGPDGAMWFTESASTANQIGRINVAGNQVTEYKVPTAACLPGGMTLGPDNRLWFTEKTGNKIGILNPGVRGPLVQTAGCDPQTGSGSTTIQMPNTPIAGNLLLMFVQSRTGTGAIATPAGWTAIGSQVNGTSCSVAAFYKYAAGNESSITVTSASTTTIAMVYEIQGSVTTGPIDAFGSSTVAAATSITSATVTPTTANSFVVSSIVTNGTNFAFPGTWTNGFSQDLSTGGREEAASALNNVAFVGVNTNETFGAAKNAVSFTVVIKMSTVYASKPALIQEITIPTPASNPDKVVIGPDLNIWFTEHDGGPPPKVGNIIVKATAPTAAINLQDCPVLDNGLTRVIWEPSNAPGFQVYVWDKALNAFNPQGKSFFVRVNFGLASPCDTWVSAGLVSLTPERSVMKVILTCSADPTSREVFFVTLQRGQIGCTIEYYPALQTNGINSCDCIIYWQPDLKVSGTGAGIPDPNDSIFKQDTYVLPYVPTSPQNTQNASAGQIYATAGTGSDLIPYPTGAVLGSSSFFGSENWVSLLRCTFDYKTVDSWQTNLTTIQAANNVLVIGSIPRAYNVSDNFFAFESLNNAGYMSMEPSFTATAPDQVTEAELCAHGTGAVIADVNASGGSAVQDSQTSEVNNTILKATTLLVAKYRIFARVRSGSGTASFRAGFPTATGGTSGTVITTTSITYIWIDLGDLLPTQPNPLLAVNAWGAAGNAVIDRVELWQLEDRVRPTAIYGGARDQGQASLYDSRALGALVAR